MNELKIIALISFGLLSVLFINQAFAVTTTDELYACAPPNPSTAPLFWQVNKTDGTIISTQNITVAGATSVEGCTSLATDPLTNTIFALIEVNFTSTGIQNDGQLATINQTDASATIVASLGDRYVGLTFLENGEMRAVSSFNHADTGNFLYSINRTTFAQTQLCLLPFASTGLALAINWDNSTLYRGTGNVPLSPPPFFGTIESIDNETIDPCGITSANYTGTQMDEIRGFSYNTNDSIFYYGGNRFPSSFVGFGTMSTSGVSTGISSPFPLNPRGLTFLLNVGVDTTDPVISTTVPEPIPIPENSIFDEFEFVSCIDDTDGDITNSMITVGTVDTSKPKSYFVDYTCTDIATNSATLFNVHYIVKRSGTGSGGEAVSTPTITTTAPTGDGVTPLLSVVPEPEGEIDRAFDLFATLNQLFAPTEPTPTAPVAPTPPSLEQVRQQNLIEAIQSFFARLFG